MSIDITKLNDNEIEEIFKDDNVSDIEKNFILENSSDRIKILPTQIFIECMKYVDIEILSNQYIDKLNSLTYEDFTNLIYEGLYDVECLLYVIKTSVFQEHLANEKKNKTALKLQIFELTSKIYLYNDSIEQLVKIGQDVNELMQHEKKDPENVKALIHSYFSSVIEHIDEIDLNSKIMNKCLVILQNIIKLNIRLDFKILEFYILFRIKELDLTEECKEVIIRNDKKPSTFGDFQGSTGRLRIFENYLENVFNEVNQQIKASGNIDFINRFFNLNMLEMISHELGHVVNDKKCNLNEKKSIDDLNTNPYFNYWYRNGMLHYTIGAEKYIENHGRFICENQADLFAIFDIDRIMNSYFKGVFTDNEIQYLTQKNCQKILDFYTTQIEDRIEFVTPIQKFDAFFNEMIPAEEKRILQDIEFNDFNTMEKLLFGADIPPIVLNKISDIAHQKVIATNLYSYIEPTIKQIENEYRGKK